MSGLHRRLRRLEGQCGVQTCPECGGLDGEPRLALHIDGEGSDGPPLPDQCPSCGRMLVLRLEFDSDVDLLT